MFLIKNRKPVKIGDIFGLLTVIEEPIYLNGEQKVKCICKCGKIKENINANRMKIGKIRSCGCLIGGKIKHGCALENKRTKLYNIWISMKQRCFNKNDKGYKWYGAKGIKVCKKWMDFIVFKDWAMNNGYKEGLTIHRKDSNKDYCSENCIWLTISDNSQEIYQEKRRLMDRINYLEQKLKENNISF